jgi:integrase
VLQLAETKNGRRRGVAMSRAVYDVLSNLPGKKEEGLCFRRKDGAAWGDVRTAFEPACRRAKIADFRFHDLLHTCASWLIMRGRSLEEVQESSASRVQHVPMPTSAPIAFASGRRAGGVPGGFSTKISTRW